MSEVKTWTIDSECLIHSGLNKPVDMVLKSDYEDLKAKLAKAEEVIAEQGSIIQEIANKFNQTTFHKLCSLADVRNRFFKFVNVNGECHEWIGSLSKAGYGQLSINNRPYLAHRISCAIHKNQFFDFHIVDHICSNRKCVNPDHLRLVGSRLNSIENSKSKASINNAKTHCKNGHPLSGDNLHLKSVNGGTKFHRSCRTCEKIWRQKTKSGKKAREYLRGEG